VRLVQVDVVGPQASQLMPAEEVVALAHGHCGSIGGS
jgi:hypothetical protein